MNRDNQIRKPKFIKTRNESYCRPPFLGVRGKGNATNLKVGVNALESEGGGGHYSKKSKI